MKLLNVRLTNHPFLGTQDICFCDRNGSPCKMVILAGENGLGKSTILDIIYDFTQLRFNGINNGEVREIDIFLTLREINSIRYPSGGIDCLTHIKSDKVITIGIEVLNRTMSRYLIINGQRTKCKDFFQSTHSIRILGSIYMDHNVNSRNISVGPKMLDGSSWHGRRSSTKGFNSEMGIRQRLLEIELDFKRNQRINEVYGKSFTESNEKDTTYDLNNAINKLIPELSVEGLTNRNRNVLMGKFGNTFPFDKLSSGEKQILGITSYLTYDLGISTGAIILIDEPENNLHPKIQLQLRSYFRALFPSETQFIVATHSPFIIHDDLKKNEKVLMFSIVSQKIEIKDSGKYVSWDHSKEVNKAFQLDTLFDKLKKSPIILVEGETDEKYLLEIKRLFFKKLNFRINWVGSYNSSGQVVFTGSSVLDKVKEVMSSNLDLLSNKLILLYDCDVSNINCTVNGQLIVEKMTKNINSSIMDKGIENSLLIPTNLDLKDFYSSKTIVRSYGCSTINMDFNKSKFCDYVCSLPDSQKRQYFSFLAKELKRIIQKIDT